MHRSQRRRPSCGIAAICLFASACSSSPRGADVISPKSPDAEKSTPFDFHSGAWANLDLVLYGQALKRTGHLKGGGGGNGLVVLDGIDSVKLEPNEQGPWEAAVAFYASQYSERDPTFDDELAVIHDKLSAAEMDRDLGQSGLPPALSHVLEGAMPVYRAHWWAEDDRKNRAWISGIATSFERDGARLPAELAAIYQNEWPKQPLRVDVTRFATWGGAYSTLGPDHITISSADQRNAAPDGLESLLHEASHTLIRPVRNALDKELLAAHKSADGLWHALLFFSAGYVVKRHFPDYHPYAYKYDLYSGRWAAYRQPLERHWSPYLEGRTSFDSAIHDVVSSL